MRQYGLPFTATIKALLVLVTADFAPVPNMTTLQLFGGYHQGQKSGTSRTTPETLTQTTSYNPNFEPEAQNDPHTPNTAQPTKQRPPPPPQKKKKKAGHILLQGHLRTVENRSHVGVQHIVWRQLDACERVWHVCASEVSC